MKTVITCNVPFISRRIAVLCEVGGSDEILVNITDVDKWYVLQPVTNNAGENVSTFISTAKPVSKNIAGQLYPYIN